MEKQKQKARVIALPTDKPTGLFRIGPQWFNSVVMKARTDNEGYHLYFVTDEEITRKDWYVDTDLQQVFSAERRRVKFHDYAKKIVATTNPELWPYNHSTTWEFDDYECNDGMGKIAPDFVEAFVKAEGKITEVLLGYKLERDFGVETYEGDPVYVLDLNASGQVKVYPVEEKKYSREQLWEAASTAHHLGQQLADYTYFKNWFDKTYPE